MNTSIGCGVIGFPKPVVKWTRSLSSIPAGSSLDADHALVIKNTKMLDRGAYICTAKNPIGQVTKIVVLDVKTVGMYFCSGYRGKGATLLEKNRRHYLTVFSITTLCHSHWQAYTLNCSHTFARNPFFGLHADFANKDPGLYMGQSMPPFSVYISCIKGSQFKAQ
jgi:hypothetical protein